MRRSGVRFPKAAPTPKPLSGFLFVPGRGFAFLHPPADSRGRGDKKPLHLVSTRKMGDGLVFCTDEFVRR
jgi:hypothetical protein